MATMFALPAMAAMATQRAARAVFEEWKWLAMVMDDVAGPVDLIANVHPVEAVRDADEVCLQKFGSFPGVLGGLDQDTSPVLR